MLSGDRRGQPQLIPWTSIRERIADEVVVAKSFAEGLDSPCSDCTTTSCCTHVPLQTFKVTNLVDLDHARYLLNFDRILLGIASNGDWSVYYVYPCRHLDRDDLSCTVHGTSDQPQICSKYNPYNCWYRRVFSKSVSEEFLQVDRPRFEWLAEQIEFDDNRTIVKVPDWRTLMEGMEALVDTPAPVTPEPAMTDSAFDGWTAIARGAAPKDEPLPVFSFEQSTSPCTSCAAYCCETLVFPQSAPSSISSFDYYRFCMGFPGLEIGVAADGTWSIVVKTRCRHLDGNRCSIYGKKERPLTCTYYDEWTCSYRPRFGQARPEGYLRLKLEQWKWLTECFQFDSFGEIAHFPTFADIRAHVEGRLREGTAGPSAAGASVVAAPGE
jgi:Fe-S-cluster containining protein